MTEVLTLIKREYSKEDAEREVLCTLQSIGTQEFYQASIFFKHTQLNRYIPLTDSCMQHTCQKFQIMFGGGYPR